MKKVFLTGADGMLGSSICRELIKQNYSVKAICLNERHLKNLLGLDIEIVYANVLNKEDIHRHMEGCDYVIHVAASTVMWPRRDSNVINVNIHGTLNVMEAVKACQVKRMVHIGTASSFKEGTMEKPADETSAYKGWKYGMDYMDSKYKVQETLLKEFKTSGFPIIILNPTYMIGPFDAGPSSGKMLIGIYNNTIPGYSKGGKNFVCSQDVAVAAVNALTMGRTGECYIVGNQNLSYKDFFMKASKVMGKEFKMKQIPFWFVLFIGAINSVFARIFGRPPQLSYGLATLSKLGLYFSPEKARTELKMPNTPIEEGIKQCIDWFKANGYIK